MLSGNTVGVLDAKRCLIPNDGLQNVNLTRVHISEIQRNNLNHRETFYFSIFQQAEFYSLRGRTFPFVIFSNWYYDLKAIPRRHDKSIFIDFLNKNINTRVKVL